VKKPKEIGLFDDECIFIWRIKKASFWFWKALIFTIAYLRGQYRISLWSAESDDKPLQVPK
jgi:hypothetical protein